MKLTIGFGCALATVLSLGCGKDDGAEAMGPAKPQRRSGLQTGADCDLIGKKTVERSMADTPPGTSDEQRKALQAVSEEAGLAIARRCKEDGWSGPAVSCGLTAKDAARECGDKLTAEQIQKMTDEVQAIFERGMAAVPPPPPVLPPPSTP